MNQEHKIELASIALRTILFTLLLPFAFFIPDAFLFIEVGRYLGAINSLVLIILVSIVVCFLCLWASSHFKRSMNEKEYSDFLKGRKKKVIVLTSLLLSVIVMSFFSLGFILVAQQNAEKISRFVAQNTNETLQSYVGNLTIFLNANLKCCYHKQEMIYRCYENLVFNGYIAPWVMNLFGINQAECILFQGWGACGEAAIVLEQVMHDSGYQTRVAHSVGADHEWAEVKNGTNWLIVDPWYIGNLVNIQMLRNMKPEFQHAAGVQVQYYGNTTWVDDSKEHGY